MFIMRFGGREGNQTVEEEIVGDEGRLVDGVFRNLIGKLSD